MAYTQGSLLDNTRYSSTTRNNNNKPQENLALNSSRETVSPEAENP